MAHETTSYRVERVLRERPKSANAAQRAAGVSMSCTNLMTEVCWSVVVVGGPDDGRTYSTFSTKRQAMAKIVQLEKR